MSKIKRIFIEVASPPFLATLWLLVSSFKVEPISDMLLGFIPCLIFAYVFGIFPAIAYAAVMELWFHFGLRARFGFLCTVGLSCVLGAAGGCLSAAIGSGLGFLIPPDCIYFLKVGAFIGLLIGLYVSRRKISAASYDGSSVKR